MISVSCVFLVVLKLVMGKALFYCFILSLRTYEVVKTSVPACGTWNINTIISTLAKQMG